MKLVCLENLNRVHKLINYQDPIPKKQPSCLKVKEQFPTQDNGVNRRTDKQMDKGNAVYPLL